MFLHMFGVAALGKPVLALGIIASAYGAGTAVARLEHRVPNPPAHEIATTTLSFEALLSECVARYKRGATTTKEACDKAIAASGLTADAFAARYRSLLVPPAPKTEKPAPTYTTRTSATTVPTTVSFEALLSECVARYRRGATNTKEACDRAIAASGLSTDAFVTKYRSLLVPPAKTATAKPTATPKPTTAPKLDTSDPKVKDCLAKYEALKTLKTGDPKTFEVALSAFKSTCITLLRTRG